MTTNRSQSTTQSSRDDPAAVTRAARIRARRDLAWYIKALRCWLKAGSKLLNGATDSATTWSIADQMNEPGAGLATVYVVTVQDCDGYFVPVVAGANRGAAQTGLRLWREEEADNPHWTRYSEVRPVPFVAGPFHDDDRDWHELEIAAQHQVALEVDRVMGEEPIKGWG